MGILYIPGLLHSATIEVRNQGQNSEKKLQGEILVIEDAGSSVYEFALGVIHGGQSNQLVDSFAGQMHNPNWTIIVNLESLFLVVTHIVWNAYGTNGINNQVFWGRTLDIQDVADSRTRWLDSETHFINRMGLKQEESVLIDLVKRLYKLLFPADIRISEICESASDPER
ncbi:hypothetical protein GGH15_001593 [Coemansia sp. RSA 562]|nr:hypothetical protein GGH15_001593 [Coemansia sp. RSA 562]KAJ2291765.1 hypothetical protein IW141_002443 [Coemansia sp. RSA 355]